MAEGKRGGPRARNRAVQRDRIARHLTRPRPHRPLAEFLATAAAMAGDDVEDALVAVKKDAEEVPTRDRIKKALPPGAADPAKAKKAGGK